MADKEPKDRLKAKEKKRERKLRERRENPVQNAAAIAAAARGAHDRMQVIHIGQRKTATTWLQLVLREAQESTNAFELVHGEARTWASANSHVPTDDVDWDGLVPFMSEWRDRNVFLSLESLISFDHERMAAGLAEALPHAKILISTRSPRGYLRSACSHAIRSGRQLDPERFAEKFAENSMGRSHDIVTVQAAYTKAFSPEAITFLPFELIRDNQAAFLAEVSKMCGMELSQYLDRVPTRRNFSPPACFLGLALLANDRFAKNDPEWGGSEEWQALLKVSAHATGYSKELWPILERRVRRLGVDFELPDVPAHLAEGFRAMEAPLRDMPIYAPYLVDYGLAEAPPKTDVEVDLDEDDFDDDEAADAA